MIRWSVVLLLAATTGCGRVEDVQGRVTLDGRPLKDAIVVFWNENQLDEPAGGAVSREDGSYSLTATRNPASPTWRPGPHRVQVVDRAMSGYRRREGKPLIPWRYWSKTDTPLVVDLADGGNSLPDLQLTSE